MICPADVGLLLLDNIGLLFLEHCKLDAGAEHE